jgi:hypothetical protein
MLPGHGSVSFARRRNLYGLLKLPTSGQGQELTSAGHGSMSDKSPEADIELRCVDVAKEYPRGVSKSTFPAME